MLRLSSYGFAALVILGCLALQTHAQRSSFSVGTASAAPGKKATGYLEVPAGVDAATQLPVVVINGAKHGPVLALVSGAHGTEYVSIVALEKVINLLDPDEISGTVILLPLVNVPSFEQKIAHVNPVDGKSMNRFYPGRIDGTQAFGVTRAVENPVLGFADGGLERREVERAQVAPDSRHRVGDVRDQLPRRGLLIGEVRVAERRATSPP